MWLATCEKCQGSGDSVRDPAPSGPHDPQKSLMNQIERAEPSDSALGVRFFVRSIVEGDDGGLTGGEFGGGGAFVDGHFDGIAGGVVGSHLIVESVTSGRKVES